GGEETPPGARHHDVQAAAVAAHVEHDARGVAGEEAGDRAPDLARRIDLEHRRQLVLDADVAGAAGQPPPLDGAAPQGLGGAELDRTPLPPILASPSPRR